MGASSSRPPPPTLTNDTLSTRPTRIMTIHNNPYKAKHPWPPDFSQLSPKHQFRLERRYRRRSKLKWARPGWTKGVKIAQWSSAMLILSYGIFFMDWGREDTVFQGARRWYKKKADAFWTMNTHTSSPRPSVKAAPEADRLK